MSTPPADLNPSGSRGCLVLSVSVSRSPPAKDARDCIGMARSWRGVFSGEGELTVSLPVTGSVRGFLFIGPLRFLVARRARGDASNFDLRAAAGIAIKERSNVA